MRGEDVMPLPPDEREASHDLGLGWRRIGRALGNTQLVTSREMSVSGWEGLSHEEYVAEVSSLRGHTQDLMEHFPAIACALDQWESALDNAISRAVPRLWEEYDAVKARYEIERRSFGEQVLAAEAAGTPYTPYEKNRVYEKLANIRDEECSRILGLYDAAMERLDGAAQGVARIIRSHIDMIVAPSTAAEGPRAIGAALFNDMPFVDGLAEWRSAQEVAIHIRAAMEDPDLTKEKLEAFDREYSGLLENPFIAAALSEVMSPQEMLTTTVRWSSFDSADEATVSHVVQSLGTALVLSTGGMNLARGMEATQESFELVRGRIRTSRGESLVDLTARRMAELQAAGRTTYTLSDYGSSWLGEPVASYDILSQILGKAAEDNPDLSLGAGFFIAPPGGRSVAQDIVAWDHEVQEWAGKDGYRIGPLLFESDSAIRDPLHSMYLLMDQPDNLQALIGADPHHLTAAQHNLLQANTGRMDAIRGFLTGETPFDVDITAEQERHYGWHRGGPEATSRPLNMTQYLTGWRQGSVGNDYFGFQDGGEAFGKMIQEVSAHTELLPAPKPEDFGGKDTASYVAAHNAWVVTAERDDAATNIAGQFLVGYQDGLDWDDSTINGEDIFGKSNGRLRSWAGPILAPHLKGIAFSLASPDTGIELARTAYPDDKEPFMLKLNADMADRITGNHGVFVDLAFDTPSSGDTAHSASGSGRAPALQTLIRAAGDAYAVDLSRELEGNTPDDLHDAASAQKRWAFLLNDINVAPGVRGMEEGAAMDASNQAFRDLVSRGVGMIPVKEVLDAFDGGKGLTWIAEQTKGQGLSWLGNWYTTNNEEAASVQVTEAHNGVEEYMRQVTYSVLAENDYGGDDPACQPEAWANGDQGRDSFWDDSHEVLPYATMTPAQQRSFRDFIQFTDGYPKSYQDALIESIVPSLNEAQDERSETTK